jgi:hypothetical protein
MIDGPDQTELDERVEAADYLAALSGDLALLARRHGFDTLGYILEMAKMEAEQVGRSGNSRH